MVTKVTEIENEAWGVDHGVDDKMFTQRWCYGTEMWLMHWLTLDFLHVCFVFTLKERLFACILSLFFWQQPYDPRQSHSYDGYHEDHGSRAEVISRMDQDIRQLERNYEVII